MSSICLDSQVYPHLWDRVRSYAPPELLLRLRLVDRESSAKATRALFDHVVITRATGLDMRSARGCRLPVPRLDESHKNAYLPKLPPGPWEHTRVLDFEACVRGLDDQPLPDLKYVRRRVWSEDALPAPIFVDILRLPANPGEDAYMDNVSESTKRHVVVVLYDPEAEGIESDNIMNVDMLQESVHGVFVFRACKPEKDGRAGTEHEAEPVGGKLGNDGDDTDDDLEGEASGIGADTASDASDLNDTPDADNAHRTFLNNFLWCAAQRIHNEYTFVGLESVPTHILAKEFKRDLAEVTAREAEPEWAAYLADAVLEGIRAIPRDPGWEEEEVDERDVAQVVKVLTMDAFREQVGNEAWMLETFVDLE
ncbi:uncharacterized protein CcaverHIS019_0500230 [Cutaneotrichosporon cavernicola]|uniref:Uncharacterized protein n=1 Tax=Cutaneotrichosporon cavernicola TaxID=279322 RepID=A0AA48L5N8_9TREE|nr:uncharacterized protein CcaverHIS019_0500230 [Cutaneotrichosporon cavernicola]BEI92395.1 hypothetical protein CcaverHIS019_0500230 [Cutaneotrichosporon cavernicola]BEJ00168.1 hypothetical protein CcaverHIS631_0500250 [Cutaneotrichosporon cavernicola]BEJ07939.1 hypothetical protein CcaverHIS641_0500240 [Cutaneotrichosporon cavernicola]